MNYNAIIVRYGEISLKGKNRKSFEVQLRRDIKSFMVSGGVSHSGIIIRRGRIYIHGVTELPELRKIFGLHSYSPAWMIERTKTALMDAWEMFLPGLRDAASFRVSCQRVDKRFPATSVEVEQEIGGQLFERTGIPVNLRAPAVECNIEIGEDGIYLFYEKIPAFGGMPFGSAGKLISLISSGIDSPVATFLMMKRGVQPVLLHFQIREEDTRKVYKLRDKLQEYASGRELKLIVIPRDDIFRGKFIELYDNTRYHSFICVICKYLMHKKAGEIAAQEKAFGVTTGDNLAQVASQTLKNLFAYHRASGYPVYSPLISFDKQQTIAIAREIGTYELSIESAYGCTPPKTPKTGVKQDIITRILKETDLL